MSDLQDIRYAAGLRGGSLGLDRRSFLASRVGLAATQTAVLIRPCLAPGILGGGRLGAAGTSPQTILTPFRFR